MVKRRTDHPVRRDSLMARPMNKHSTLLTRRDILKAAAAITAGTHVAAVAADQHRWRVAIIGHTGRGNYGHGLHRMWLELRETKTVGIADPEDAGRAAAAAAVGMPPAFADYREMLAQLHPDIVVVAPR